MLAFLSTCILPINFIDKSLQLQANSSMNFDRLKLEDLLEIIEIICSNAGYSRFINQGMLADHRTYFDICQLIFSQLSIKIFKIQENKKATPGQKLQGLINLLSQELQIDEFDISGEEIIRFNTDHIQRFLQILYQYSKIYMESKKPTNVVKSQTEEGKRSKENQRPAFSSARGERGTRSRDNDEEKYQQLYQPQKEEEELPNGSYLRPEKTLKKAHRYSTREKRARSQQEVRKNMHLGVVHKIMEEKTKMLRAASRDNRKNRLEGVKEAKDSYKIFLTRYAKENRATQVRKKVLKEKSKVKPISQQLPQKDFEAIDKFFESFTYKFRDKKAAYLRRIQKLARQQELDRYCHQNRLDRQMKKYMKDRLEEEMKAEMHQHRVRSEMLRESSKVLDEHIINTKKQIKMRDSRDKRELKQVKKKQLKRIEDAMKEQNEKVLMSLEEGGRLEKIIMEMYKRF